MCVHWLKTQRQPSLQKQSDFDSLQAYAEMVANAVPTSDPVEIARNRAAQHKYICWRAEKVGHAALISVFRLIFLPFNDF
jgi:hypothetical protein